MGRGASKAGGSSKRGGGSVTPAKTLYSKSQADELTKDYTSEMFLGNIENTYNGTLNNLREAAEQNMPETLNVGGYTFESMGKPHTSFEETRGGKIRDVVTMDYQSTEKIGSEYPVLQVGVRVWKTPKGKVKSEIIRDGYTNKTRFW